MLTRIEIDSETNDVSFFFEDSGDQPFSISEFKGQTRSRLMNILGSIDSFRYWVGETEYVIADQIRKVEDEVS